MAKLPVRAAIIGLLAFMLMGALFAAAAHDTHDEEHDTLTCATCFLASHLEHVDIPPAIVALDREPSPLEDTIIPAAQIGRSVLKVKARAPPLRVTPEKL